MRRTRIVPAAPVQSASATWSVIAELVVSALETSIISNDDVEAAVACLGGVGRSLISGGHLDKHPIILVAPPVHLSIYTVSGPDAFRTEAPRTVPGGSSATEWKLYLPTPEVLVDVITAAIQEHPHLSIDDAPTTVPSTAAAALDGNALASLGDES
jgi:hypothetical protein